MKNHYLNPNSKAIEFWIDSETKEVMAVYRGKITPFKDADTEVGTQLMAHIVYSKHFDAMYDEGFIDPIAMMEEYIRRNFAGFDGKADIDGENFNIEFTGHQINNHPVRLTPREWEYVKLACQDLADKQIAAMMQISPFTVNIFRKKAQQKTQTNSKPGLVSWAHQNAII